MATLLIRRPIQQLSPSLVNRIAAGEVIERPASVVKELIENALDAGATRITIEVEDGGRQLIRVTDDGHGIPPDDLALAFASHATSKLIDDEDLFRISTMGFRGEALASIGSVSHSRICSRTSDAGAVAHEIRNNGGDVGEPQAASANAGTMIEVRDLFFNVPARRKFLKGTATEFGYISDAVLRTALPYPFVEFRLLHHGRVSMQLPIVPRAEDRWLAGWPDDFAGGRMAIDTSAAVGIDRSSERVAERNAYVLGGVIALPEHARPALKYQHIYLNGRPIRDKTIQHALREAYRGLTEPGRHPATVLMLTAPPGEVDVNVHPTKSEVRFRDSGRVHSLVMASVRERLIGSDLAPRALPRAADAEDPVRLDMQARLAAFFKGSLAGAIGDPQDDEQPPLISDVAARSAAPVSSDSLGSPASFAPPVSPVSLALSLPSSPLSPPTAPFHASESPPPNNITAVPAPAISPSAYPTRSSASAFPAIQLHNSYLVAQSADGLIIIDQHALHERIMFEELLARVTAGPLESQRMLIPRTLPASPRQMAMLEEIQPLLHRLGIEVTPFGPDVAAVQAFPSFLDKLDPCEFIGELMDRGENDLRELREEELLHEVLDMMSCKAAVKAGDPLTPAEVDALLARRELVERSSNCPHGRPTTLRLSLRDLEKQFKRTGF